MASIRELKDRLSRLENGAATREDIDFIRNVISALAVRLNGIFRIGRPMKPKKRIRRARLFCELAELILTLKSNEKIYIALKESFDDLEELARIVRERAEIFEQNYTRKKKDLLSVR